MEPSQEPGFLSQMMMGSSNEEVDTVVVAIHNMEKTIPAQPTPFNVLLLKMFLFAQGKGQALVDPIKGGTKKNIQEWM